MTELPNLIVTPVAAGVALLLLAGLPALAAATGIRESQVEEVSAARPGVYLSASLSMAILAAIAWAVTRFQGISAASIGWRVPPATAATAWAAAVTAAGLLAVWGITAAGRRLGLRESALALALMPRTTRERRWFVFLAVVAAIGEEYIYRGFLLHLFARWWGEPWLAVAATAVSFGVAHGYQRAVGMARATVLGGLLAVPVVWTGSLFPAVAAHFWINAAIGLGGWKRLYPGGPSTGAAAGGGVARDGAHGDRAGASGSATGESEADTSTERGVE